jgi:hypothetical protein
MWKCKHCSEELESNFDSCWKCGYDKGGKPAPEQKVEPAEAALLSGELLSRVATSAPGTAQRISRAAISLKARYSSAYDVARGYTILGAFVRWGGLAVAVAVLAAGVGIGGGFAFGGFAIACFIAIMAVGFAAAIAAQGQMLLAQLDTAVNTSPLLSKNDVAAILFEAQGDV